MVVIFVEKFRGAAHSKCNLEYEDSKSIPVIFHNTIKYDGNFLTKEVVNGFLENVKVILTTKDKYISFSVKSQNFFSNKHKKESWI